MTENRPALPEPSQREVRKRCFFGCVVCGRPVFDYDHVEEWSKVKEHHPDNIVLLCQNCHGDKTNGRLDMDTLKHWQSNPFNKGRLLTPEFAFQKSRKVSTIIGSNSADYQFGAQGGEFYPLVVGYQAFFVVHCEDSWLTFSFKVTNERGKPLLLVNRGQLKVATSNWDYDYQGKRFKVRDKHKSVIFDAELSNSEVRILRGQFIDGNRDGFRVESDGAMHAVKSGSKVHKIDNNCFINTPAPFVLYNMDNQPPEQEVPDDGTGLVIT